jgi:hypothetical protein
MDQERNDYPAWNRRRLEILASLVRDWLMILIHGANEMKNRDSESHRLQERARFYVRCRERVPKQSGVSR